MLVPNLRGAAAEFFRIIPRHDPGTSSANRALQRRSSIVEACSSAVAGGRRRTGSPMPEKAGLRSATDIAGVTRQELRAAPEVYYTPERLDVAHRFEILAIDPLRLPPALIERYIPRLVWYRLYDRLAEAFEKVGYSDNLEFAW